MAHLSLAACYLMANTIPIGTLIAFLHDFSDIFTQAAKVADNTGHKNQALIYFFICQVIWLVLRLIAMPVLLMDIRKLRYEPDRAHLQPYVTMSEIFLAMLLLLHAYWFLLILKMDYNALCKKKYDDIQQPVHERRAKDESKTIKVVKMH